MARRKEPAVDLSALADTLSTATKATRLRLDWIREPEQIRRLFDVDAKAVLVVGVDFSRPPAPERARLWPGWEGDIYDLSRALDDFGYALMGARVRDRHQALDFSDHPELAARVRSALKLDAAAYFLSVAHAFEAAHWPYAADGVRNRSLAPRGDTSMTWFVRERLPRVCPEIADDPVEAWATYQAGLKRLGFSGGALRQRPCAGCARIVNSDDPSVTLYLHCRNQAGMSEPDVDRDGDDSLDAWKAAGVVAVLPKYDSIDELEKDLLRRRWVWSQYCSWRVTAEDAASVDFPERALDWFFYEGLYDCFDGPHFLATALLTAAETLVRAHGFAWRLRDGEVFISHPRLAEPLAAASLVARYGAYLPYPFESGDDVDLYAEMNDGLDKKWHYTIRRAARSVWPPLTDVDLRAAFRRAAFRAGKGRPEPKDAAVFVEWLARIPDDAEWTGWEWAHCIRVDRERFGFEARKPIRPGQHDEWSGELSWDAAEGWQALFDAPDRDQPDLPDEEPKTDDTPPILVTARDGDVETLTRLLDGNPALMERPYGSEGLFPGMFPELQDTPLVTAAENGRLEAVRFLLSRGAKSSMNPYHPCPALSRAAANGHVAVVEALLDHGVAPEHPVPSESVSTDEDTDGEEPPEDPEATEAWRQAKIAEIMAEVDEESLATAPTPLMLAAEKGHAEVVRLLLARGADPHRVVQWVPASALHAGWFHREVVDALLAAGVPVDQRDRFGKTPLHLAAIWGKLHGQLGGDAPSGMRAEAELFLEGLKYLLAAGANINARDNEGETPLHHAADGTAEYVAWLIGQGADPHAVSNNGRTVLDMAEEHGNTAVYPLLKLKAV